MTLPHRPNHPRAPILQEDLIGSGTYKSVFRAFDNESGVAVAWMELKKRHKMVHSERDQLRQEVALLKALRHPSLLTFHDVLELPEKTVLITELVTSGTLRQYLQRTGTPSLRVLQSWCQQLLRGLDYLHSRNPVVIHRDIKADNIFVDGTSGELKIGDMGLACLCHDGFASAVIGTPAFMAPEMLTEHYNEAVDIWAFGMTVLEMVTLEYPYEECSHDAQIFMRISNVGLGGEGGVGGGGTTGLPSSPCLPAALVAGAPRTSSDAGPAPKITARGRGSEDTRLYPLLHRAQRCPPVCSPALAHQIPFRGGPSPSHHLGTYPF